MECLRESRSKVNGKFLSQYIGKPVTILGNVLKVNPNGSSIDIKSTDNQVITITLNSPLNELVEGWIEVRGVAQGKTVVNCHHLVMLPREIMAKFDAELFDDLICVINTCNNPWANAEGN